ncbi:MAG TPA: nucleotide exchange factor GrpE [Verrucomicrobiae bacterium]|nr:nucleotide exchange factor GrpE [Verrucomicrobiae bacterium]
MASHGHREKDAALEQERPADPPADQGLNAASLAEQVQKLQSEKQELMDTLVRRQADFENYRKRVEKERHHERHRGVESLIEHLLPVLDALDRALAGTSDAAYVEYRKGFELIRRQLWETLAKQGLVRIESLGQDFNPHFHHAIQRVETTEHADGIVIDELQPGYVFHERVLRPAMVRVAAAPEEQSAHKSRREN